MVYRSSGRMVGQTLKLVGFDPSFNFFSKRDRLTA